VIDGLLTSLASLLNSVGAHDTQLGQLIGNFDTLVQGLAASKSQLGSAITNLDTLTTTVSGLLNQSQPQLDQDIGGLATATPGPWPPTRPESTICCRASPASSTP
jgi:phospholipid/cholesterol/gamma-HCH transport system substrate-binding protein